jgi:transcriptional/translational regulatory protein YebC/TACO1
MAEAGAVAWQFTKQGYISIVSPFDEDEIFLVAADAGADDVTFEDDLAEVYTEIDVLHEIRSSLEDAGFDIKEVSVIFTPTSSVELGKSEALQVMKLVETLEDLDDVQNVYTTIEITDEAFAELAAV